MSRVDFLLHFFLTIPLCFRFLVSETNQLFLLFFIILYSRSSFLIAKFWLVRPTNQKRYRVLLEIAEHIVPSCYLQTDIVGACFPYMTDYVLAM